MTLDPELTPPLATLSPVMHENPMKSLSKLYSKSTYWLLRPDYRGNSTAPIYISFHFRECTLNYSYILILNVIQSQLQRACDIVVSICRFKRCNGV